MRTQKVQGSASRSVFRTAVSLAILLIVATGSHGSPVEFSENTKSLMGLFRELYWFKNEPKFHQVGFGTCCKYNDWKKRSDELTRKAQSEKDWRPYEETGVHPGELYVLAIEYMQNEGGVKDSFAKKIEEKMVKAVRAAGDKTIVTHAEWVADEIDEYVIRPCAQHLAARLQIKVQVARNRLAGSLRQFAVSVRAQAEGQPWPLRRKLYDIGLEMCKASGA